MNISEHIVKARKHVLKQIEKEKKLIQSLPEGELASYKKDSHLYIYQRIRSDKNKTVKLIYLSKAKRRLAEALALKQIHLWNLESLQNLLNACDAFLSVYDEAFHNLSQKVTQSEAISLLAKPEIFVSTEADKKWISQDYKKSIEHPEQLIYRTIAGTYVRSKSEMMIANTLYLRGLCVRYEMLTDVGGQTYATDFSIFKAKTNTIAAWEHFGMMDNQTYRGHALHKISDYMSGGYIPGDNLIFTFESQNTPYDQEYIDAVIDHYFD